MPNVLVDRLGIANPSSVLVRWTRLHSLEDTQGEGEGLGFGRGVYGDGREEQTRDDDRGDKNDPDLMRSAVTATGMRMSVRLEGQRDVHSKSPEEPDAKISDPLQRRHSQRVGPTRRYPSAKRKCAKMEVAFTGRES